ncbi:MAG: molybdopterin-binding protein, partial [Oscillospiraceae bacterium]
MNVSIICVGCIFLLEGTTDAIMKFLTKEISGLGLHISNIEVVESSRSKLQSCVAAAIKENNIVITVGGLGVDDDDMSKSVICSGLQLD